MIFHFVFGNNELVVNAINQRISEISIIKIISKLNVRNIPIMAEKTIITIIKLIR
jgi:hypothetical protein